MVSEFGYIFPDALAAEGTAEEQAAFINRFATTLFRVCGGPGYNKRELQLCRIADHLDGAGNEAIVQLADFVKLTVESRAEQRKVERDLREEINRLEDRKRELLAEVERLANAE